MILAFAARTASALDDGFCGSGVFASPAVGIMGNGMGTIEPWSTGCMLIGPVDVGLLFGIMNNSRPPGWFDARIKGDCLSGQAGFLSSGNVTEYQRVTLAGVAGLEPATPGFGDRCSTN
jgi:hypothetical protein